MSWTQFQHYNEFLYKRYDYDSVKWEYENYKINPEDWREEWFDGLDYKTGIKWFEEMLASPITINGPEGQTAISCFKFTNTYINALSNNVADVMPKYLSSVDPDYSCRAANGEVIADDLPLGYYIIIPDGKYVTAEDAVIPINLTNVTADKVVKSKASPFTITKSADITNASVGDVITFTISGPLYWDESKFNPSISKEELFHFIGDTMQGMVLTGDWSFSLNGNEQFSSKNQDDYWIKRYLRALDEFVEDLNHYFPEQIYYYPNDQETIDKYLSSNYIKMLPVEGNSSFVVCLNYLSYFKPESLEDSSLEEFSFTYTAVVTEEAIRGSSGNPNDSMLITFYPDWSSRSVEIESRSDQETIYTYDMNLLKYADGDTSKVLPGAQFALYKQDEDGNKLYYKLTEEATLVEGKTFTGPKVTWVDIGDKTINQAIADGDITAVTSGQDGKAVFTGIPHDTYYLQEVKAPNGYNLLAEDKMVELTEDAPADFEVQVENTGGALLPETGGPGTVLFTMVGLLLMAGAVTIYLANKRNHNNI